MGVIEKLEELLKAEKYYELYELLKVNINRVNQNDNVVLKSINALIDNDYIEDARELVSSLYLRKSKRIIVKILKNKIKDKKSINDYDEDVYKIYFEARKLGHEYYVNGDIESAYYTYEWGYYVTENPVFLYYMGKMIYKTLNYKLAEEYFNKYIRHCGEKASKAYLYLGCIANYYHRGNEALAYIETSNEISDTENSGYRIDHFNIQQDETIDPVEMYNQYIAEFLGVDYFEESIDCQEFYEIRDLYISGNTNRANELLSNLESKKQKSLEEKMAIGLLKRNRKLYQAKNRS